MNVPITRRRAGTTVMELVVACGLLAAVTAAVLPAARRLDGVRREADRRRRAVAELTTVLTDLAARPPAELRAAFGGAGDGSGVAVAVRGAFAASVPGAALRVAAVPVEGPAGVGAVRLDGALTWQTDFGRPAAPVMLSAWAFGPVGPLPPGGGEEGGGEEEVTNESTGGGR